MKDSLVKEKDQCCGCGSCVLACPTGAIKMVPRELGCLYPEIDTRKCVNCRRCEQVCAFAGEEKRNQTAPRTLAAAAKDGAILKRSASGGVFAALAHRFIDAGGVVYGCSLETVDGLLSPVHIGVQDHGEVAKLQGSKYVQSSLGTVFEEIRQLLKEGRIVLFSGTPCQVDALKHFVKGTDTSNLYTVDIICHGVPSAELFRKYLKTLESPQKKKITAFYFRDKSRGWGLQASYMYQRKNGAVKTQKLPSGLSSYYSFFLQSETYRESCYSCPYANAARVGDITIGDFWGIEQEHPRYLRENGGKFSVRDGISAILVNGPHGEELIAAFGDALEQETSGLESVARWNSQLRGPSVHSGVRWELAVAYDAEGYSGVERIFRQRLGIRYPVRKIKQWYADKLKH